MTTSAEEVNATMAQVEKFGDMIESMKRKNLEKSERIAFARTHLESIVAKAKQFDDAKDELKALDTQFACLAMLKKIIDLELFDLDQEQYDVQRLLITYDVPSSLKMCKILLDSQSYEQVTQLAERVLAIDPQNKEALFFLGQVKQQKNQAAEWDHLKSSQDIKQLFKEHVERQDEKQQHREEAHVDEVDPAKVIPQSIEAIIKVALVLPYTIFSKGLEPAMIGFYELCIYPFYVGFLLQIPIFSTLLQFFIGIITSMLRLSTRILNYFSGKQKAQDLKGLENHSQLSEQVGDDLKQLLKTKFKCC